MIDKYTQHMRRRRLSEGTIRLRLHYLHHFAETTDLATAQHDDLDAYVWSNPAWSSNTRAVVTATLKSFYRWAQRERLILVDPSRDLPAIDARRRRPRIATEEQILRAIRCDSLTDKAMIMLGAECGLRVNEIATLHRSARDGEWLTVIGKGSKQRTLNLSPELMAVLGTIERTTMRAGWYFPGKSPRTHMHPSTAWRHITRILESNPHSLRRRAGTIVYRRGGNDIRLAQEFLGHKSPVTTSMYLDVGDDNLKLASSLTRLAA